MQNASKAVIMVGGVGSRLRPFTHAIPKPLLPIGQKPILQIILEQLSNCGFQELFLSTGYGEEMIKAYFRNGKKYGVHIKYVTEDRPLGTVGALRYLEGDLDDDFLFMNGDLLTKLNFGKMYRFHKEHNPILTVGVKNYDIDIPYGVLTTNEVDVVGIQEKPKHCCLINAGIYIGSPKMLSYVPKGERLDVTDLIKILLESKERVVTYKIEEYWLDIGRIEDFAAASNNFDQLGF
jgi:NDP-sugar pyrophosphorylase family protein